MGLLKVISDADFETGVPAPLTYEERGASRAVVFDKDKNVALLHVTKWNFHKLPGGGIEEGETIEQALHREVLEEIGCEITNIRELGVIEEYRNGLTLHQISHCFVADLVGAKGNPDLDEGELADGFETVWLSLDMAIQTLEGEAPREHYEGKFIQLRDLTFLKAAREF